MLLTPVEVTACDDSALSIFSFAGSFLRVIGESSY